MKNWARFLCLALTLLAGCVRPTPLDPSLLPVSEEEYRVYAALIFEVCFASPGGSMVVIADSTSIGGDLAGVLMPHSQSDPDIPADLIQPLEAINRNQATLDSVRFPASLNTVLANSKDLRKLTGIDWSPFYQLYKGAQGLMTLSRVAFSLDGDQALVYFTMTSRFLAGRGSLAYLEKQNGAWVVKALQGLWIS